MKKFLSMVLALALIISLVPSVFADGETETQKGAKILYSVGTDAYAITSEEPYAYLTTPDYITTNGFYDFYDTNQNISTSGTEIRKRYNSLQLSNNRAVVYEVYIPVAGNYTMEMYNSIYSSAKFANVYLSTDAELKKNGGVLKSTSSAKAEEIKASLGNYIGKYDCSTDGGETVTGTFSNLVTEPNLIPDFEIPEAGYYTIAFYADGGNVSVGDFYLTCGTGDTIPMTMATGVGNDTLKIGETETTEMTATAYMSDGNPVTENYTVTYTSSDENIATIDKSGLVTAKAYGINPVEITASATIDGCTLENSEKITVNAEGIEIPFKVGTDVNTNKNDGFLNALNYNYTNGFYKFAGTTHTTANLTIDESLSTLRTREGGLQVGKNVVVAFEVHIPQAGYYTMKMWNPEYQGGAVTKVYASSADGYDINNLGSPVGQYDCYKEGTGNRFPIRVEDNPNIITGFNFKTPGEYVISFVPENSYGFIGNFTLISGTDAELAPMPTVISVDDQLTLGQETTAKVVKLSSDGETKVAIDSTEIISSDPEIVSVDENGNVKALALGTATLSASATYNGTLEELKVDIVVSDKYAGQKISFAATGASTVSVGGKDQSGYEDLEVLNIARGDKIRVVADTSDTTKTFRGWVRGAADSGRLVSNSAKYEFTAMTHTMLSAVYSDNTETGRDVVEYYGWNEQYITTLPADAEDEPTAPTLTGYEFAKWVLGQSDDNIARKVAQYTVLDTEYNVTVPDGISVFVEGGKYVYDAKVTCTAEDDVYWYRDDKLVDYGKTYSFYIWDNTEITTSSTGKDGAKIMLDKSKNGEFMVEYDAGNEEIVEVGLLFGNSSDITIDNCSDKMNSQRNGAHGQFTASKGGNTTARGYLIYNDNGTYRVIYAD